MKGSLPAEFLEVLERSTTADYVTIDGRGQPVVWPLAPRYQATEGCIDVTVSRAQADVRVALLFSDPVAMILVQGTAHPEGRGADEEIDVHVLPERVYVWRGSDLEAEPQLYDAHVDEVRSAHNEEPEVGHAPPAGGGSVWDERLDALGARHPDAVLAFVGPDGFPFAVRVPVRAERDAGLVLVDADPVGAPIEPGLACLCADAPARLPCPRRSRRGPGRVGPAAAAGRRARARRLMAGLTVAVTGPTGEIGRAFIRSLERSRDVGRIVGMARRPFDPAAHGWKRTEYRRGDVLDRASVEGLVEGADVVVHLAFVVLKAGSETRHVNVEGSRNVFEAAVAAGAKRLVYSSSVAAYGFPEGFDGLLTEDMPALGHARHPYSAHKAEVEEILDEALSGGETDAWVFRPCIVAGPDAPALITQARWPDRLPGPLASLAGAVGVLPDPGVPFQLVHHDDVATALRAGVVGRGEPGAYNLAAAGEITMSDLAAAIGYRTVPMPKLAVEAAAELVAHLPFLPEEASWVEALRRPVLMDASKARRLLNWRPRYDAQETLRLTVSERSR
jgi:UDP-glucose 4-epimerase